MNASFIWKTSKDLSECFLGNKGHKKKWAPVKEAHLIISLLEDELPVLSKITITQVNLTLR